MRNCHDSHYIHCRNNLFFSLLFFRLFFFLSSSSSFLCRAHLVWLQQRVQMWRKRRNKNKIVLHFHRVRENHIILICYYVVALHRKFVLSLSLFVCVCVFGFAEAEVISLSCMCTAFESSFCGLFPQEYGARIIEFGFQKDCAHCFSNYMDD